MRWPTKKGICVLLCVVAFALGLVILTRYMIPYSADEALRDLRSGVPIRVQKGLEFFSQYTSDYTPSVGDELLHILAESPDNALALKGLGLGRDKRAVGPILSRIASGHVTMESVVALGQIGDRRALEPLLHMWREGRRDSWVLAAIAQLADKYAEPEMIAASRSPDEWTRHIAAKGLGRCGTESAGKRLVEMWATEKNVEVRVAISIGLGIWGSEEAVAVLAPRYKELTDAGLVRPLGHEEHYELHWVSKALAVTRRASAMIVFVERFRTLSNIDLTKLPSTSQIVSDLKAARDLSGDCSWAKPGERVREHDGYPSTIRGHIKKGLTWWAQNREEVEMLARRGEVLPRAREPDPQVFTK